MLVSALLGQAPITHDDKLVYKALLEISPSSINPDKNFPLGKPPPPNAVYQSRSPSMIIGSSFAIALIIFITSARLVVRKFHLHSFGPDDWMIIPTALACITYIAIDIATEREGCLGKRLYECTYQELDWFVQLAQINFPIFYLAVFTVKISITLQNQRITGITSRSWKYAHWTYLAILLTLLPICVFLNAFQCSPVAAGYSLKALGAMAHPSQVKCLNKNAISIATRSLHIVTDFALLCMPIIVIARLQVPLSKKLRLGIVFCVGGISCVASVMRNVVILRSSTDYTWDLYKVYAWDVVDIAFAAFVASLPALNSILDIAFRKGKEYALRSKRSGSFLISRLRFYGARGRSSREGASDDFGLSSSGRRQRRTSQESRDPIITAKDVRQHFGTEMGDYIGRKMDDEAYVLTTK